ncbi:hypothetical protein NQ095_08435 [Rossellomorea sp. SC111]|uniref:hypothetical protein n=1 Tax=Rossellomorea sp. SC111 TaxID=2968985 RepID=UPI00215A7F32|nr:hypothetical protein [Rossellomorea sp. SC111]MCR8848426.1 hypothetical protein [Rossellomorea sp. SC111]
MNIVWMEMKKIFNWKILLLLTFVNVILYYMLVQFDIEYFPNGRPALDSYRVGVEMVEKYGPDMNESEKADFRERYEQEVQKADRFIKGREDFKKAGIQSYGEFKSHNGTLFERVYFEEGINLFWELQARETLLDFQRNQDTIMTNQINRAEISQKKKLKDLKETGQNDLYPDVSLRNMEEIFRNIAIVVLISVLLIVSPMFLNDRNKQMPELQYTSKTGRQLFQKKFAAGMLSSFIVITVLLAVYLSLYSLNDPSAFFDVPINSFVAAHYWYHLTFFQYIVLSIVAIYVLGFILAVISMAISNLAPSFISLIGIQVLVVLTLLIFGLKYILSLMVSMGVPIWLVPVLYGILIMGAILVTWRLWMRERKLDIVL